MSSPKPTTESALETSPFVTGALRLALPVSAGAPEKTLRTAVAVPVSESEAPPVSAPAPPETTATTADPMPAPAEITAMEETTPTATPGESTADMTSKEEPPQPLLPTSSEGLNVCSEPIEADIPAGTADNEQSASRPSRRGDGDDAEPNSHSALPPTPVPAPNDPILGAVSSSSPPAASTSPSPSSASLSRTISSTPTPALAAPPPPPYWTHSRTAPPAAISTAAMAPAPQASRRIGDLALLSPRPAPFSPTAPSSSLFPNTASQQPPQQQSYQHHRPRRDSADSTTDGTLITLQDNEVDPETAGDGNRGGFGADPFNLHLKPSQRCWAKCVDVTDYVIVQGGGGSSSNSNRSNRSGSSSSHMNGGGGGAGPLGAGRIGAFVVWTVRVETLQGGTIWVHKRYSEFDALRRKLVTTFPRATSAALPPLPPKSMLNNFRPQFLDQRRSGLQYFLNCILLNPEFSGSPILKEFLFS